MLRKLWSRAVTWIRPDPARVSASIHVEPNTNTIIVRPFIHVRDQRLPITPELATHDTVRHGDRWLRILPAHKDILDALLQSLSLDLTDSSNLAASWRSSAPDLRHAQRLASVVGTLRDIDGLHLTPQAERLIQSAQCPVQTAVSTSIDFNRGAGTLDVTITERTPSGAASGAPLTAPDLASLNAPRLVNGQFLQVNSSQREAVQALFRSAGADGFTPSISGVTYSTPIGDLSRVQALAGALEASRDHVSFQIASQAARLLQSAVNPIEAGLAAHVDYNATTGTLNAVLTERLPSGDVLSQSSPGATGESSGSTGATLRCTPPAHGSSQSSGPSPVSVATRPAIMRCERSSPLRPSSKLPG
jgi:hypothetical protein